MKGLPIIETERLILRSFTLDDAPAVQALAGDKDIASTTLHIPHPYEDGMAEQWISTHQDEYEKGEQVTLVITLRQDGSIIGAISLAFNQRDERAELGYWIGKSHWNQGYCTEASEAVLQYGFEVVGLKRIHASHFTRNPASGQVMKKLGMTYEGTLRQHVKKWDRFEDMVIFGILMSEYKNRKRA